MDGDPRVGHMLTELPYNPGGHIQHLLLTATSEEVSGVQNGKLLKIFLLTLAIIKYIHVTNSSHTQKVNI